MLIDDKERLVELFTDNLLWGNIQIKISAFADEAKLPQEQRVAYRLGAFARLRRTKTRDNEYEETIAILATFYVTHRMLGDISGELRDREHEQIVKKLQEDNERLVSIVADQKKELATLYKESPDKSNIRGIS